MEKVVYEDLIGSYLITLDEAERLKESYGGNIYKKYHIRGNYLKLNSILSSGKKQSELFELNEPFLKAVRYKIF